MDVVIELYDTSGRQLWRHAESGVPASEVYTVKWDLSVDGGRPLGTGIYLLTMQLPEGALKGDRNDYPEAAQWQT